LLFRYGTTENGSIVKKAHIYTQEEHGIDPALIDADAQWVMRGLRKGGFSAFVVGGAVRDLMVGRTPHDFDIATDAHPQQVKRVFRSARIIGRRFRIVHVYSGREKYVEVTTFRSRSAVGTAGHREHPDLNNSFGTMEEDAERRDFTINALYYNPFDKLVIDYVGGVPDIRQRRLRTLGDAEASFAEDPVRMIRAVKYAALTGFPVPPAMASLIRRMRESILACSRERVTEEVYKILTSGAAADIMDLAHTLRLFEVIFPALAADLAANRQKFAAGELAGRLRALDEETRRGKELGRNDMFGFLFRGLVIARPDLLDGDEPAYLVQKFIREVSEPLFPSKKDLLTAADSILGEVRPHARAHASAHEPAARGAAAHHRVRGAPARQGQKNPETGAGEVRRRRRRRGGRRRGGGAGAAAPPA
jgi:poly(A) polymerase